MTLRSIFGLVDLAVRVVKRVRGWLGPWDDPDATEPVFPLTHKDVDGIERQIRTATEQRPEMRPPPPSSRYR